MLLLERAGLQVERLNAIVHHAGVQCAIAVAPYAAVWRGSVDVRPDLFPHDKHVGRRTVPPPAVGMLPQWATIAPSKAYSVPGIV